jgi:cysteine synthase
MEHSSILSTVGNTPVIQLASLRGRKGSRVHAKLEFFNPGRSVKDRIALNIIERAEADGSLRPGALVMESSSGNTGIGLSMVCRVKGLRNVVVVDQNCPIEKLAILRALGAMVVKLTSRSSRGADLTQMRIRLIEEIQRRAEVFVPNQYENRNAPLAHYETTAKEILDFIANQSKRVGTVMISVGTGGTITGVSRRLKEVDPSIRVIGVEPKGSTLFGGCKGPYLQQGPGNYFIPKNLCHDHIDEGIKVGDSDAFRMCWQMARREGVLLGGSSGAVLAAAVQRAAIEADDILCVLPDGGEKYLETIFNEAWLARNSIPLDEPPQRTVIEVDSESQMDYDLLTRILCDAPQHQHTAQVSAIDAKLSERAS